MNVFKPFLGAMMTLCFIFCIQINVSLGQSCSPCIYSVVQPECPGIGITYAAQTDDHEACNIKWEVTNGVIRRNGNSYSSWGPSPINNANGMVVRWNNTHEAGKLKVTVTGCTNTSSNGTHEITVPIKSLTGQSLPGLQLLGGLSGSTVPYCTDDFVVRIGSGTPIYVGNIQNATTGTGVMPDLYAWLVPAGWTVEGVVSDGTNRIGTTTPQATIGTSGCEAGQIRVRARYLSCGNPSIPETVSEDRVMNISRGQIGRLDPNRLSVRCGLEDVVAIQVKDIPCKSHHIVEATPPGWTYIIQVGDYVVYRSNGQNGGTFSVRTYLDCGASVVNSINIPIIPPSLSPISGLDELCSNNTVTYSLPTGFPNSSYPASSFSWTVSPNLQIVGANTGLSVDVKPLSVSVENGPGWVRVSSCPNQSNQKDIHIGVPSHINISAQVDPSSPGASAPYDELCYGQDNYVTTSYPFDVNTFSWSLSGGNAWIQPIDNQTVLVHPYSFNNVTLSVRAINNCGISPPITYGFDVKSCGFFFNGVQDPASSPSLSVSPNPASDILHISLEQDAAKAELYGGETELILYNSNQIEVKRSKTSDLQTQLDVKDLDPGLYFLKVFRGKEVEVKKILISRK